MARKILITRLAGLGDVASILIPAVRLVHDKEPDATIDVLTHGAGIELMSLCGEVSDVLGITPEQWPRDLIPATQSFLNIAQVIAPRGYDRIICLDTWFMPCFLAQVLIDIGLNVEGNHLDRPVGDFFTALHAGQLPADYFGTAFMASSYPRMNDWLRPWWRTPQPHANYPEYYLIHCCGLGDSIDPRLPIEPDVAFREAAAGLPIVATSFRGTTAIKHYKQADALTSLLRQAGYHVWTGFDGSLPMRTTLSRLAVTNLLVTVATSTQWLAKLAGCPSLMLPGAMHPAILGAEHTMDQTVDCQYCCQRGCPAGRDYACMDVPAQDVMARIRRILAG
jgi:ADP-heptose:LPS heptosyltransferase